MSIIVRANRPVNKTSLGNWFQELILSGNEIKQPGALSVAECVSNKDNLKLVDLNGMFEKCSLSLPF